jgi:hypothetical protein
MTRQDVQDLIDELQERSAVENAVLERLGETDEAIRIVDDLDSYRWVTGGSDDVSPDAEQGGSVPSG